MSKSLADHQQQKAVDSQLVSRGRNGDERALHELYVRHSGRLLGLAIRLSGSRADAEDVVQDAFIRAFRNLKSFRGDSTFKTWIYRITVNLCRDLNKRRPFTSLQSDIEQPARQGDAIARKSLEIALGELSDGYREVLVLHDVLELKHQEIADIMGVKVGTSKSQLHKARTGMRKLLARHRQSDVGAENGGQA